MARKGRTGKRIPKNKRGKPKAVKKYQPNYTGKKNQTGKTMTRAQVQKKTAARLKKKRPNLKGKGFKKTLRQETTRGVARRQDRGMKVTGNKKK